MAASARDLKRLFSAGVSTHRSNDLLFRELMAWVPKFAESRRDCRRLYCVVIVRTGRRSVGLLGVGSNIANSRLNLSGITLLGLGDGWLNLYIGYHRLNLSGITLLDLGDGWLSLYIGYPRLNLGGITLLDLGKAWLSLYIGYPGSTSAASPCSTSAPAGSPSTASPSSRSPAAGSIGTPQCRLNFA